MNNAQTAIFREVYKNITTNAAQLNAGAYIVIEDQTNALKSGNLPHNQLVVTNTDGSSTLFLFFDNMIDQTKPDLVLFPNQTAVIDHREGYAWTTLFIKNTHATNNIAAAAIKIRVSTVKKEG